jgi:hypothetical protein
MPAAYATRMHTADAEEKRTEESTNGESFVTSSMNLALGNARELSAHA